MSRKEEERKEFVRFLISQGKRYQDIGRILGLSRQTVRELCLRLGIKCRDRRVMTPEKINAAVEYRKSGLTFQDIASRLGVSLDAVYRHVRNPKPPMQERIDSALMLHHTGQTVAEIASRLSVSKRTVRGYLTRAGLSKSAFDRRRKMTPEKTERAIELWNQGVRWEEIASRLNVSDATVREYIANAGLWKSAFDRRRKMTPEKIEHAIELRNQGLYWAEIAAALDVSTDTLRSHLRGICQVPRVKRKRRLNW